MYAIASLVVYMKTSRLENQVLKLRKKKNKEKTISIGENIVSISFYVSIAAACVFLNRKEDIHDGIHIIIAIIIITGCLNLHTTLETYLQPPGLEKIDEIRLLGRTRGFRSAESRRKMWSVLVNSIEDTSSSLPSSQSPSKNDSNQIVSFQKDSNVIEADVKRSMFQFDVTRPEVMSKSKRKKYRTHLRRTLIAACERGEQRYYQGLHDVASVFLLVCGDAKGRDIVVRLARTRLKDYMGHDLSKPLDILELIYPLLQHSDHDLYKYMKRSQVGTVFALSWFLTWFSHNIDRLDTISRLFDFVLSSHPLSPVYIIVAMLRSVKSELRSSVSCDMASLIHYLRDKPSQICSNETSLNRVLSDTNYLMQEFKPSKLRKYANDQESWSVSSHFDSTFELPPSSFSPWVASTTLLALWFCGMTPLLCIYSHHFFLILFMWVRVFT